MLARQGGRKEGVKVSSKKRWMSASQIMELKDKPAKPGEAAKFNTGAKLELGKPAKPREATKINLGAKLELMGKPTKPGESAKFNLMGAKLTHKGMDMVGEGAKVDMVGHMMVVGEEDYE